MTTYTTISALLLSFHPFYFIILSLLSYKQSHFFLLSYKPAVRIKEKMNKLNMRVWSYEEFTNKFVKEKRKARRAQERASGDAALGVKLSRPDSPSGLRKKNRFDVCQWDSLRDRLSCLIFRNWAFSFDTLPVSIFLSLVPS